MMFYQDCSFPKCFLGNHCLDAGFIAKDGFQRGVGLVEVMIALLLLSSALLGMSMLQIKSLQYQRASYSETMAQLLAADMAERIQSNLGALANYDGKTTSTIADSCTESCTNKQRLVEHDLNAWKASIEKIENAALTDGEGRIAIEKIEDIESADGNSTLSLDSSVSLQRITLTILWKETLKNIQDTSDKSTSRAEFTFEVQSL